MSIVRRAWLVGATVVILAAGFAAGASPRRAQEFASTRDARHAAGSSRPAGETPAIAPVPETPRPAPPPPARVRPPRDVPRAEPAPSASVTMVLEDPPAPEPMPMTWEDLFPPQPGSSRSGGSSTPCFDQLQGIGGASPCSEVTERALK